MHNKSIATGEGYLWGVTDAMLRPIGKVENIEISLPDSHQFKAPKEMPDISYTAVEFNVVMHGYAQRELIESIEKLHWRLEIFVGRAWTKEIQEALLALARRSTKSYLQLLEETVQDVVDRSAHYPKLKYPGQL